MKTTTQTPITHLHFTDEMNYALIKLEFITDAIRYWNSDTADLTENNLFGFGLITEDIITEIKELVEKIEK